MKSIQLFIICLLCFGAVSAQQTTQETVKQLPNTVENQLNTLYKKSGSYQVYKVIKKDAYKRLQRNILDSISSIKKDVVAKQLQINKQQESIAGLEDTIKKLNTDLSSSLTKEDSMSFLGLQLSKVTYNSILWGLIILLLASLVFFIYKFTSSNVLTKQAENTLTEVEDEFEQYRKKTLVNEQQLRRKLQDEINKQKG